MSDHDIDPVGYYKERATTDLLAENQRLTDTIADYDRENQAMLNEIARLEAEVERLREALKFAAEYYVMLERATGVEHGVLKEIRAALGES